MTIESEPLYSATLFQFVAEHIHPPKGRWRTSGRTTALPDEMPLVEEAGLVFRIITAAPHITGTRPAAGDMDCDPEATTSTFRKTFSCSKARTSARRSFASAPTRHDANKL